MITSPGIPGTDGTWNHTYWPAAGRVASACVLDGLAVPLTPAGLPNWTNSPGFSCTDVLPIACCCPLASGLLNVSWTVAAWLVALEIPPTITPGLSPPWLTTRKLRSLMRPLPWELPSPPPLPCSPPSWPLLPSPGLNGVAIVAGFVAEQPASASATPAAATPVRSDAIRRCTTRRLGFTVRALLVLRAARRRPVPVCVVRPVPARLDDRGSQPTG